MDDLRELTAFRNECEALERSLTAVPDEAWSLPALGEWTLAELAAHVTRGAGRLDEYAQLDPGGQEPVCDRVTYWHADPAADASTIAQRARDAATGVPPTEWPQLFAGAWRAAAERATSLEPESLIHSRCGPMQVVEYLATRVLEVTVHHLDVRAALDLPPAGTIEAERVTMAILELLLDGPRPRNLGRQRFILAATGRVAVDDPRFPVLR